MSWLVGDDLPEWRLPQVEPARMKVLALLLADPNPIHYDQAAAAALGIADGLVNQGPSNLAIIYNLLAASFPGSLVRRLDVQLLGNVMAGDSLVARGTVTAISDTGADITCSVQLELVGSGVVISGEARIDLSKSPSTAPKETSHA